MVFFFSERRVVVRKSRKEPGDQRHRGRHYLNRTAHRMLALPQRGEHLKEMGTPCTVWGWGTAGRGKSQCEGSGAGGREDSWFSPGAAWACKAAVEDTSDLPGDRPCRAWQGAGRTVAFTLRKMGSDARGPGRGATWADSHTNEVLLAEWRILFHDKYCESITFKKGDHEW